MKKTIITTLLAFIFISESANAQNFDDYFMDQTLRIDYLFNGNAQQ